MSLPSIDIIKYIMNKISEKKKELIERFDNSFIVYKTSWDRREAREFFIKALDQVIITLSVTVEQETVKNILVFLDELEMNQPDYAKTDNWRNWKYIRNSIVDKYSLFQPHHDDPQECKCHCHTDKDGRLAAIGIQCKCIKHCKHCAEGKKE